MVNTYFAEPWIAGSSFTTSSKIAGNNTQKIYRARTSRRFQRMEHTYMRQQIMVYYKLSMIKLVRFLIYISLFSSACYADIGVLIPGDQEQPDPSILTLDEVRVEIRIDHQYARTRILQIFGNHTARRMEGKYVFAIPGDAAISDFAVWDDVVRIPGVILERKRASEIYENLKMQQIDPGLLQQQEGAEGPRMASAFSARIVPIMPFGTKRLEIEYTQRLNIEGTKSYFSLPLKPDLFRQQMAGKVSISLDVQSDAPIADFKLVSSVYPLQFSAQGPQRVTGKFEASKLALTEDFALQYRLDVPKSNLYFLPYRATEKSMRDTGKPITAFEKPSAQKLEDGYFWLSALLNEASKQPDHAPRSIVILLDTSSSMRWEKLDQAYTALEYFLQHLTDQDEFQLILFHQEVLAQTEKPVGATKENVDRALAFVKSQYLMGGTDFEKALQAATNSSSLLKSKDRYLVLITDGNPTLTYVKTREILKHFQDANAQAKFRVFCFGIGSDSNRNLLSDLSQKSNGSFDWVQENEDLSFKLEAFFAKIGQYPATNLTFSTSQQDLTYQVYPADPAQVYDGSSLDWFGRYKRPTKDVSVSIQGDWQASPLQLQTKVDFPEEATEHDFIPRAWARKRVDALLREIELNGEDDKLIDEIIALSKKYKFVTPYTSFLAAPRSLLRPRVIRPGDPLLRVKTDPEIVSVIAIFPFGLVKPLEYLASEDIWQTRFLVPKEMEDGTYQCRLILRDRAGNQYEEPKSFLVDSKPPVFNARWEGNFSRGRTVKLLISADKDTRSIYARFDRMMPVRIEWNAQEKRSVGYITVPADLPAGTYQLQIIGEDFAHNESTWTRNVEVF
ncbi:MAG: VWA domain-containing protein [Acidobacteria bacterium]|nr:MAG: VWA domain-containing protein [Acidobacteriota bacterium]